MSELRLILLVAGLALLLGLWLWGRSRGPRRGSAEAQRPLEAESAVTETGGPAPPDGSLAEPRIDLRHEPRLEPVVNFESPSPVEDGPTAAAVSTPPPASSPVRREPRIGATDPFVATQAADSLASERPQRRGADGAARRRVAEHARSGAAEEARATQKIIAVRVTAPPPDRFDGAALRDAIEGLDLRHGRFGIYHRLETQGRPVFSCASLLEPGTFDPETMAGVAYPGVTLFAVLPGPVPGHHALDDLMATARSIAEQLGGQLQDERGAALTVQRMAQLREEVTAFERGLAREASA